MTIQEYVEWKENNPQEFEQVSKECLESWVKEAIKHELSDVAFKSPTIDKNLQGVTYRTILEALTKICSCEDCWVFIVSGRSREEMEKSMQGIPFLGLASEEGYFYRLPNKYVECRIVNK